MLPSLSSFSGNIKTALDIGERFLVGFQNRFYATCGDADFSPRGDIDDKTMPFAVADEPRL